MEMTMRDGHRRARSRGRKEQVRRWVADGDMDALVAECDRRGAARVVRDVLRLAYDGEESVRWRSLVALGNVAAVQARRDVEPVREWMRRIMWWMNDESGALMRCGCEAMAEVMVRVPDLRPEYGHLLASYLDEEPFEAGSRWAIARLGALEPELLRDAAPRIERTLDAPDPSWRAYGAMALAALDALDPRSARVGALLEDQRTVSVFDAETLDLRSRAVGSVVRGLIRAAEARA